MKNQRSYALVILGIAILIGSIALSEASGLHGASADSEKDVVVVNTTANPVPVNTQGTTNIAGLVQAQQNGAWNVGLTGTPTVRVGNTTNAPVLVRDVDSPGRGAFQLELDVPIPAGSISASNSFPVPEGKRFVIEFASASVKSPTGARIWVRIQTSVNNSVNAHSLTPVLQGPFASGGGDFFLVSQPMRVYADSGTQLSVICDVLGAVANSNTGAAVVMSGHLVSVP